MTAIPFYKKDILIGGVLPLTAYASLTPKERIWLSEQQSIAQKEADEMTITLLESVSKTLKCSEVDAMVALQAVERGEADAKQEAAVELAIIKNRKETKNNILEQFTFIIDSRLDRNRFDSTTLSRYGVVIEPNAPWSMANTIAIESLHPELQAFIDGEIKGDKIEDEPAQPKTAGESLPVSTSA